MEFGKCPRVYCSGQPLLPVGVTDQPFTTAVKLFCPKCEDVYNPKYGKYTNIDGAYFGSSFPHMLFQVYPNLAPKKTADRYVPRIFGFRMHKHTQRVTPPPDGLLPADGALNGNAAVDKSLLDAARSGTAMDVSADTPESL